MPHPPFNPHDLHEDQIVELLRSGAHAALLSAYFGEVEYRELSQLARLAATRRNPRGKLVFILPGIMGSRLGHLQRGAAHVLWLHPTAVTEGRLADLALPGPRTLGAVGVMLPGYLKLKLSLETQGFRPVFYPFDWRADLEKLGRQFIRTVEASGERKVFIVAHSMGGLVARVALGLDRERRIAKLLQLGAPNGGSFAPLQALRAVYPTVRKIAALDHVHSAEQLARNVFQTFPGLFQMLPAADSDTAINLLDSASWPGDGLTPDPAMLSRARRVRERLPIADERCRTIAGVEQETISAVNRLDNEFEYEIRCDGDGTVLAHCAAWGERVWSVRENHGALVQNNVVLAAIDDILRDDETARLSAGLSASPAPVLRKVTDSQLRTCATRKVDWESLSLDSRRRILEPVITPEFRA